jgi:glyoxylate reductase
MRILRAGAAVRVWDRDEVPPPRDVLMREAAESDGIISLVTDGIDDELLARAPNLRVVANYAVGFDNIDVEAATRRGVVVTNTPGVLTETTADLAWTLLMATARRVVEAEAFTRSGKWKSWQPELLLGQDVHGSTLGLIGLGRIGAAVARRASGFEMTILYHDVVRREDLEASLGLRYRPLEDVLSESDFVSVHTPLTPDTKHLINRNRLRLMKRTAILINTSRGPVVDEAALHEALRDGVIWAAGMDVYEREPLPLDSPLLSLPNVVALPHVASASFETRSRMAEMAAENCLAVLNGRVPANPVNPDVLARLGIGARP